MDLAYLRENPHLLPTFLTHQRIRETPLPGGAICAASRLTLDSGESLFTKTLPGGRATPPGFFTAESRGLRWLREARGAPTPEVILAADDLLALEWIDHGTPGPAAAERFGRELAAVHRAGAPAFGADWQGYIGSLPLDNTPSQGPWGQWFAQRRLLPYLRMSTDNGALSAADAARVEQVLCKIDELAGPAGGESPARLHGDLWPGNVLWAADGRAWLVDPAAHGGSRETDLALLALFGGLPYLDRVLAAYDEDWPLADGWRRRTPLHQLHLLLVHTALFGGGYRSAVLDAVGAALRI